MLVVRFRQNSKRWDFLLYNCEIMDVTPFVKFAIATWISYDV